MLDIILGKPIEFIKENLTGWIILILAVLIIYFIFLRNYYNRQEQFYDKYQQEELEEELEEELDVNTKKNTTSQQITKTLETSETIERLKITKNNKAKNNKANRKEIKEKHDEVNEMIESFESSIQKEDNKLENISTTLFDNLNLSEKQLLDSKANYNDAIAQLFIDLGNLNDSYSKNRFINVRKQFDNIIAKCVDKIINYLANPIKSPLVLTRTAIRTDILNISYNALENLINKTNNEIPNAMNQLVMLNSTTPEYKQQLQEISRLRNQLERYIGIDKLLNEMGSNVGVSNREINSILDKSFILPMYERNYDKLAQMIKSDFNNNESNLAMKYSKAYGDFLEQQKKDELDINPLSLASKIESGIVNLLTINNKTTSTEDINTKNIDKPVIEQLTRDYGYTTETLISAKENPIPTQESKLLSQAISGMNVDNIIKDNSSRGSYLIEGFETSSPNLIKAMSMNNNKNKKPGIDDTSITNLLSGDFLQYMLDKINSYIFDGYDKYKNMYKNMYGDKFKIEDNMIPLGFFLFILSMLFYFVDITS